MTIYMKYVIGITILLFTILLILILIKIFPSNRLYPNPVFFPLFIFYEKSCVPAAQSSTVPRKLKFFETDKKENNKKRPCMSESSQVFCFFATFSTADPIIPSTQLTLAHSLENLTCTQFFLHYNIHTLTWNECKRFAFS